MKGYVIIFMLFNLFCSCKKDKTEKVDGDYVEFIVFGLQQCVSHTDETCVEIWKMEPGRIMEAASLEPPVPGAAYNGQYTIQLPAIKYTQIEPLFDGKIPDDLLNRDSGILGETTGIFWYFEYKKGDVYKYWLINNNFSETSSISAFKNVISQAFSTAQTP